MSIERGCCGTLHGSEHRSTCEKHKSASPAGSHKAMLEAARARGAMNYRNGMVVGDNPYDEHDERHWAWMGGWADEGLERLKSQM